MITISHCVGLLTLWQECSSSSYELFRDRFECFKTINFAGQDCFYGLHILAKIEIVLDLWKWCSCIQTYVSLLFNGLVEWPNAHIFIIIQFALDVTKYLLTDSNGEHSVMFTLAVCVALGLRPRATHTPRVNITACSPATSQ